MLKQYGQLDGAGALLDDQATLAHVQQAFQELQLKSKPGDEVFIYWSGHGGTCADTGGDEQDGLDEFLVPYDANPEKVPESVLLDDSFGRWIQELDGRRVIVILDACYSGGQYAGEKGIDASTKLIQDLDKAGRNDELTPTVGAPLKSAPDDPAHAPQTFDFLDSELSRIKDIGQGDAAKGLRPHSRCDVVAAPLEYPLMSGVT